MTVYPPTMLLVALDHASHGRPIFPCDWREDPKKPGRPSKRPLIEKWPEKATTDADQIRRWWSLWPSALVGMPTGKTSGIAVLDTDIDRDPKTGEVLKDGEANLLAELRARSLELPNTIRVRTARGGLHRWFKYEPGFRSSTNILPGVDIRGDGGFVIAPGSRGAVGGSWDYEDDGDFLCSVKIAPPWLAEVFKTRKLPGSNGKSKPEKAMVAPTSGVSREPEFFDTTIAEDIRKALELKWDPEDYNDWALASLALHDHPQGRELWEEWASKGGTYDPVEAEKKWSQTKPSKGITARTILKRVPHETLRAWWLERIGRMPSEDAGDIGNSRAFAARFAGVLKCISPGKKYLRWTGSRWSPCEHGEEVEMAKQIALEMVGVAVSHFAENGNKSDQQKLAGAMALKNNRSRLMNMIELAKSDPLLTAHERDFDTDPMLLGVANGVVDLKTGALIAADPNQFIMRQAGTAYDPGASCPGWMQFLEDVQPDPDVRAFLQRAVGYTLTGLPNEERIFFMHGGGANGKSVFATVLARLFADYHVSIPASVLAKAKYGSSSEADRAVARLPGARLALANETSQGSVWDDQRLKELASRDPIAARRLYSEGFDFIPSHTLWIRGNHLPGAHDAGEGFWRRLISIPFKVQIPEDRRAPDLDRELAATELPGILAWAVQGCLAWQRLGLAVPSSLKAGVEDYRRDTDLLGQWMEGNLHSDPTGRMSSTSAYRSYVAFCKERGVKEPSHRLFSTQLAERGMETTRTSDGKIYKGYRVSWGGSDFEDLTSRGAG